jgi:hypothetical protein
MPQMLTRTQRTQRRQASEALQELADAFAHEARPGDPVGLLLELQAIEAAASALGL